MADVEQDRDPTIGRIDEDTIARVRAFLATTLEHMGMETSLTVREEPDEVVFEIGGTDAGLVIGKQGATLDALQLLCNRLVRRSTVPGGHWGFSLDAEGYRARREQALTRMAEKLGSQAARDGTVITMEPMSARDRRVIHMALARFPGVSTRSEGEGSERRLQIIPMPERS